MAALDWIVLVGCLTGIIYCAITMPRPMILTREQWQELPEEIRSESSDKV